MFIEVGQTHNMYGECILFLYKGPSWFMVKVIQALSNNITRTPDKDSLIAKFASVCAKVTVRCIFRIGHSWKVRESLGESS